VGDNIAYITACLPVAKNSGQSPASGDNTAYITAGLPAEIETDDQNVPEKQRHYRNLRNA